MKQINLPVLSTVTVLGTEYKIFLDKNGKFLPDDMDGQVDPTAKEIILAEVDTSRPDSIRNAETYKKAVLRHEIIHAFLYESGLWANSETVEGWGASEEITDWIALQFPKLLKAFQEVGAI